MNIFVEDVGRPVSSQEEGAVLSLERNFSLSFKEWIRGFHEEE
jgi:hypothetical protein